MEGMLEVPWRYCFSRFTIMIKRFLLCLEHILKYGNSEGGKGDLFFPLDTRGNGRKGNWKENGSLFFHLPSFLWPYLSFLSFLFKQTKGILSLHWIGLAWFITMVLSKTFSVVHYMAASGFPNSVVIYLRYCSDTAILLITFQFAGGTVY